MIRTIVMALIVANLLFFGWSQWVGDGQAALTAVANTPRRRPPVPIPTAPPSPPPCASLGPFGSELEAVQAQQKLEAGRWGVMRRDTTEQVREGYWVHVSTKGLNQQARTLNAIRGAGIQDAFAMPDDPEFRVSVGIFSDETRAEDRAARVQRLQLDATVTERTREQSMIWLDIPGVARETLSDGRLAATGLALDRLRIEACPVKPVTTEAPPAAIIPAP
jgi:hypothetical protein